jgi:uncharacterized membrane protein YesL
VDDIVDYMLLNLLTLVCCIPVFTIGAAMTARTFTAMKMLRGQSEGIKKPFFRSFKQNFRQATILTVIMFAMLLFLFWDWNLVGQEQAGLATKALLFGATIFVFMISWMVFPFLSRYTVTIGEALKGAFVMSFTHLFHSFFGLVIIIAPILFGVWHMYWAWLIWLALTTATLIINTNFFIKAFDKFDREQRIGAYENATDEELAAFEKPKKERKSKKPEVHRHTLSEAAALVNKAAEEEDEAGEELTSAGETAEDFEEAERAEDEAENSEN